MAMSAAERQRRRRERINQDPERRTAELMKERERWHKRKERDQIKSITALSDRAKRRR